MSTPTTPEVTAPNGSDRKFRTPFGMLLLKALRPTFLVLGLWLVLAAFTFWMNPQVTLFDALAIAFNANPGLGLLLGAALLVGAVNLLLSTSAGMRRAFSAVIRPFGAPWRRMPKYVQRQWITLGKWVLFALIAVAVLGILRQGDTWAMINAGITQFPMKLPEYVIGGMIQLVIFISSFLLLFVVLSRGGVTTYLPEDISTNLDQVWGQDQVVERVRETVMFLQSPEIIEDAGGHVPGGVLLWGPPGTGKTLIAEAIAGETSTPFVLVEPGAFQNMFVGIGVLRVKALYRKLRKLADVYGGVVVFFDEADVLGSRGANVGNQGPTVSPGMDAHDECGVAGLLTHPPLAKADPAPEPIKRNRAAMPMLGGADMGTLNAILAAMQGVRTPKGFKSRVRRAFGFPASAPPKFRILHIMATNLPTALDPALLRPGRIDRLFRVGFPSKEGRIRTFEGYLAKVKHDLTAAQVADIAQISPNATGAIIKDMVNEALIETLRSGRDTITYQDMLNAKRFKEFGPPEGVEYVPFERHAVAVHEACHALVAWRIRKHLTIDTVTIEKGSTYLGMVSSVPNEDLFTRWKSEYRTDIAVALASIVGERMFFADDNTSGVGGDLEAATRLAVTMLGRWGMGDALASHGVLTEASAASADEIAAKVEELLGQIYQDVSVMLTEDRARVLALAHALEVHRTLTGKDVEAVFDYRQGMEVDGRIYDSLDAQAKLEEYHATLLSARSSLLTEVPDVNDVLPRALPAEVGEWPVPAGEALTEDAIEPPVDADALSEGDDDAEPYAPGDSSE